MFSNEGASSESGAIHINFHGLGRGSYNYWGSLGYWGNGANTGATGADTVHISDTAADYMALTVRAAILQTY